MTLPSDPNEAARRLLRALAAEPGAGDHLAVQALLPEFVEAELAGDEVSARFAVVQAHLDACEICSRLHAGLLDLLLAEAAGKIPPVSELPPVRLPAPVVMRRRVRTVVASVLDLLGSSQQELEWAIQSVFGGLAPGAALATAPAVAERAGQVYSSSEAALLATATYNTLRALTAAGPASLASEQASGGAPALLERVARTEAERAHLTPAAVENFVAVAITQFGEHYLELVELAREPNLTG